MGDEHGTLPPKQLCMVIGAASVRRMPEVALPEPYALREYRKGDEVTLALALQAVGFRDCGVERVLETLEDADRRAGSALVDFRGAIVAVTLASRTSATETNPTTGNPGEPWREGVLDYVATHPDHQGRGLGRATCTAVSRYLVDRGCETVQLLTDDWRLPAIRLYLSLGYQPVTGRGDMPVRWAAIKSELEKQGYADA